MLNAPIPSNHDTHYRSESGLVLWPNFTVFRFVGVWLVRSRERQVWAGTCLTCVPNILPGLWYALSKCNAP
jgi:hypothetical protein